MADNCCMNNVYVGIVAITLPESDEASFEYWTCLEKVDEECYIDLQSFVPVGFVNDVNKTSFTLKHKRAISDGFPNIKERNVVISRWLAIKLGSRLINRLSKNEPARSYKKLPGIVKLGAEFADHIQECELARRLEKPSELSL